MSGYAKSSQMAQLLLNIVGQFSSGKTLVAKKLEEDLGFSIISGDDLRLFVYERLGKKSPKNDLLNQFLIDYRFEMMRLLLGAGENVILDGSGATQQWRQKYFTEAKKDFPEIKKIIIYAEVDEPELLRRLAQRDSGDPDMVWQTHYRKRFFEPPLRNEADELIVYDQSNYDNVSNKVASLLKA
jgi:predicted kinase